MNIVLQKWTGIIIGGFLSFFPAEGACCGRQDNGQDQPRAIRTILGESVLEDIQNHLSLHFINAWGPKSVIPQKIPRKRKLCDRSRSLEEPPLYHFQRFTPPSSPPPLMPIPRETQTIKSDFLRAGIDESGIFENKDTPTPGGVQAPKVTAENIEFLLKNDRFRLPKKWSMFDQHRVAETVSGIHEIKELRWILDTPLFSDLCKPKTLYDDLVIADTTVFKLAEKLLETYRERRSQQAAQAIMDPMSRLES